MNTNQPSAACAIQRRIQCVESLAAKAFKDHHVELLLNEGVYRHWRCSRIGSWTYGFSVVTFPGRLVVCGDIGFLAVERETDMIPWCRGSIDSIGYFAEKVPNEINVREYDPEVVAEWVAEQLRDEDVRLVADHWEVLTDLAGDSDNYADKEYVMREIYESGIVDGCDFPSFDNWMHGFLWCREGVKFLLRHLDQQTEASDA